MPINDIDYSIIDCSFAYKLMVKCSVELNHAMSIDPKGLAMSLLDAAFIAQASVDQTLELNETKTEKGSRLYSAVLSRVKVSPGKLATFVSILRTDRIYDDVLSKIDKLYRDLN